MWREGLETGLAQLEKEDFIVEVNLRKKPFDFKVLEERTNEWAARLQILLDTLISLQTHLLPGSAVVEKEEDSEREFSDVEKRQSNYLVPHLLSSLEKGLALLKLTIDSKLETQFLIRKQLKDECDSMRTELEQTRQLKIQNEEARLKRHQLRGELKQLKNLYDTQRNDLLMQVNDAQAQCAKYKAQASECERLARACEKDVSALRTRAIQLESERDSAHASTLDLRAKLLKEEEAHSKSLDELITCRQKLAITETQREALLLAQLRDTAKTAPSPDTIRSPISSPTLTISPSHLIPTHEPTPIASPSHFTPTPSHPSPLSRTPQIAQNHCSPTPSYLPTLFSTNQDMGNLHYSYNLPRGDTYKGNLRSKASLHAEVKNQDTGNLHHTYDLLHDATLHKGSLRNKGSLHAEISLAAEEKTGDLGLTERLLHARLTSLGSST